jgi:Ser-tRNA(Ala) deacylase AlaX/Flp pilus assembly protein TadD
VVGLIVGGKPVHTASEGDEVEVILEETPFYGEMGGQVGDSGKILGTQGEVSVSQAIRPVPEIIIHRAKVTKGRITVNDQVEAEVDQSQRLDIARNHTATHILQAALRAVLGEQVRQSGSLVATDRLRFDFTHPGSVSKEQLAEVQHIVNEKIMQNLPVVGETMLYTEAVSKGAIALFGEKYGDEVRMLQIGDPPVSLELCGGTHVKSTGEIGFFYITAESSVGSGMRRIEAVTGRGSEKFLEQRLSTLDSLAQELETSPEEVQDKLTTTLQELSRERKRSISLELELAKKEAEDLFSQVESTGGINLISAKVSATSPEAMREIGDRLKEKLGSGIIVLGAVYNERPNFVAMVTSDLVAKGFNAGGIVKQVAKVAGGGGGGKAEIGQGSGKEIEKLDKALESIKDIGLEQNSEDEDSLIKKGNKLSDSGKYEEALTCFDKAIELNPSNVDCWLNKGWVFGKLERHEEAIACYNKAIELDPTDDLPWYNKGNRLGDLGRYEEAIACYDEVIRMDPMDVPALYSRGNRLSDLGRYEEAVYCYDEAIRFSAYNGKIWYSKGLTLEQLGQKSEAEECFQRAKDLGFSKAN